MAKKKVFSIGRALSQGLEETIESAQNYSGELRIEIIPLKKIELDPDNPRDLLITMTDVENGIGNSDINKTRKNEELASLRSIANSITSQGIINPITVYKFGDKYRVIAGERRTLASILAGKSDIQAKILESKPDDLKVSLLQWIENIERSDLSLWERLTNLEKIVDAYCVSKKIQKNRITIEELSNLIGCVKSHAMNYKTLLNADGKLKQLIAENKIKNLEKAALISDIKFENLKQEAVDACLNGATLKQLKAIAEKSTHKIIGVQPIEGRGRKTSAINFGVTKNISVARAIIEPLLKNGNLAHVAPSIEKIDWSNARSVTEVFKQILKTLEKLHA